MRASKSTFDRMVEEPDFYVRVQKTKLVLAAILVPVALVVIWWRGY